MRHYGLRKNQKGFTIIELLVVVVLVGLLATLVISTYAGVQRNNRNRERQQDINQIYKNLEAYYVQSSQYPTLGQMNDLNWVATNMKALNKQALRDPSSKSYALVAKPTPDAYAYDVRAADGSACDNVKKICAHYTLTATLEKSAEKTYVKSSLN